MIADRIAGLLKRLREGKCTKEEIDELNDWFHNLKGGRTDFELWLAETGGEDQLTEQLFERFNEKKARKRQKQNRQIWYSAAAVILVVLATSAIFLQKRKMRDNDQQAVIEKKIIAPGTNKAVLTLADGAKIDLNDANNGYLANQSGIKVKKATNGKLVYEAAATATGEATKLIYNTIATPRAGQYEVELPDGSKVWLNAETTLRYPVKFTGDERQVELSGEAYFEIAHDTKKPFKVLTNNQLVEVLGTHFNIESYPDDENITTTLIQGSVKVTKGDFSSVIKPGQKVVNLKNSNGLTTLTADTEEALAWKNGNFIFNDEKIQDIMKKLSRWYDVDVEYSSKVSDQQFWGTYARSKSLNSLIKNLEQTHTIHFKIEGRRIIVMP